MPKINILPKDIAELIAAGEVIERPASVIKELIENSIDAGALHITVEIKNGGVTYMRVSDDGCGIAAEDVKNAFLRHATSKITEKCDLDSIMTLGFRGEALASICAVARVEILTKRPEDAFGTHYCIEGGNETLFEETGCPNGTTIIIRDIFYNIPARQKFLKKDVTEANYISAVVHKQILSHPEVSLRLIKNNKQDCCSSGDSKLISAIYAVYGRSFTNELVEVAPYKSDGITVFGYVIKPLAAKGSRGFQTFFVNKRYVHSTTCSCALEEAYKNLIMTQKFPACVLFIDINPSEVDVNVHPTKAQVRFCDEKKAFNAVYFAVKNALMLSGLHYSLDIEKAKRKELLENNAENAQSASQLVFCSPSVSGTLASQTKALIPPCAIADIQQTDIQKNSENTTFEKPSAVFESVKNIPTAPLIQAESSHSRPAVSAVVNIEDDELEISEQAPISNFKYINADSFEKKEEVQIAQNNEQAKPVVIGEVFCNYILAQCGDELVIIDKHAAHERIIFEKLKKSALSGDSQIVLQSGGVMLSEEEIIALKDNSNLLDKIGFELDYSQAPLVVPKRLPMMLDRRDIDEILPQMAQKLIFNSTDATPDIIDDILHTMACKSAVRQGDINNIEELEEIARTVIESNEIRHCPHGRPVMFSMSKAKIERQFKRC